MNFATRLTSDQFLRNNLIFFTGSLAVAFLNYLFYPLLGRMMALGSFGEVQVILSLSAMLAIFTGVFKNIVVNITSNSADFDGDRDVILMLEKFGLYAVLAITIGIIILSPWLKTFFNFSSYQPFLALAILFFTGLFFSFRQAVLQGLHDFKALTVSSVLMSAGRLLFSAILVYVGFAAFGAIIGLVMAQILALAYTYWKTRHRWGVFSGHQVQITSKIKKELVYGLLIFVATLCGTFLYSADIIVVKHYFTPEVAGLYSGLATVARIIAFVTGSVAGVLFPAIKITNSNLENRTTLTKALILVCAIGGASLLVFVLFPSFVVGLLIGARYLPLISILPKLSLLSFLASILNLFIIYHLALRRYFLIAISVIAPLSVIALSYINHSTVNAVIDNFLFGSVLVLGFFVITEGVRRYEVTRPPPLSSPCEGEGTP